MEKRLDFLEYLSKTAGRETGDSHNHQIIQDPIGLSDTELELYAQELSRYSAKDKLINAIIDLYKKQKIAEDELEEKRKDLEEKDINQLKDIYQGLSKENQDIGKEPGE